MKTSARLFVAGAMAALTLGQASMALARDAIRVLDGFGSGGYGPGAGITLSHGVIYGTTSSGGTGKCLGGLGCGTVFALTKSGGGNWTAQTLYNFLGKGDGGYPGVQLTVANSGPVYGYTSAYGNGTVFQLQPPAKQGGGWHFQAIYSFAAKDQDNLLYVASPLLLKNGRLYGVASGGVAGCGGVGCGSVFRLDPGRDGAAPWIRRTLYEFTGGADGGAPNGLAGFDADGALYAATETGNGVVRLTAPADGRGAWTAQVIAQFPGNAPYNLVLAQTGTVFGTISNFGGKARVFALTRQGDKTLWKTDLLCKIRYHGFGPASLASGPDGSLIGVFYGDQDLDFGNAFQLTPPVGGGTLWTYAELWNFNRGPSQNPENIVAGPDGRLFGVLSGGGYTNGAVFALRTRH